MTGDALSCIGAPTVTTEGVRFTLHGYAEAGISSLTVNLNGTDYTPFEGLDTNAQVRVTGVFELPTGLAANTDYTVTISAQDVNGQALAPATFSFTTLPEVTGATIVGVSTNEVKLTVSGAAAGYVVPSGWTQWAQVRAPERWRALICPAFWRDSRRQRCSEAHCGFRCMPFLISRDTLPLPCGHRDTWS